MYCAGIHYVVTYNFISFVLVQVYCRFKTEYTLCILIIDRTQSYLPTTPILSTAKLLTAGKLPKVCCML